MSQAPPVPTLLFGAMDRHNLGDLLFPHIAEALLPGQPLIHAGLAERDLRPFGGHRVQALASVAAQWGAKPLRLLQVGGEVLTCTDWQSAAMLLPAEGLQATLAYLQARPRVRSVWIQQSLGVKAHAPYVLSRALFPGATRLMFAGVGGVSLASSPPALRAEVQAKLRAADAVGVRDRQTLAHLQAAGIAARLLPDPAALVAELLGATIERHRRDGAIAELLRVFPQGYLAIQFSADFGDDATLEALAAQLDQVVAATGLGLVLFRAGAAPWHDDTAHYHGVMARLATRQVRLFESLQLWELCALIAASQGFGGSSLHGRIVAMAYGLPRVNLATSAAAARASKHAAYAATWEPSGQPGVVPPDAFAQGLLEALAMPPPLLRQTARDLAVRYRSEISAIFGADASCQ